MKKVIYQHHHPDRSNFPKYTIELRKGHHFWVSRLEKMASTGVNLKDLYNLKEAISYIEMRIRRDLL